MNYLQYDDIKVGKRYLMISRAGERTNCLEIVVLLKEQGKQNAVRVRKATDTAGPGYCKFKIGYGAIDDSIINSSSWGWILRLIV